MNVLPSGVFNESYESDMAIVRTKSQWLLLGIGLVLLFVIPQFASNYWLSWLIGLPILVVAVLGLHILTGLCGQFSIGHVAFVGVGAYTAAILASRYGVNGWVTLPLSALFAGLIGLVFGLPCFRIKAFYLAISTLAAYFIIDWCIKHFDSFTSGFHGLGLEPLSLGGIEFRSYEAKYILVVVVMIVATLFAKNLQRTRAGRAFVAIRDNDIIRDLQK